MSTGSESDFEGIGFSDCESGATGEDSSNVLVQLPPELHNFSSARSNTSGQSSVASSFVPVQQMSGLAIHSRGNLKSDDSDKDSWSHLGSTTRDADTSSMGHEARSLSSWATGPASVAGSSIVSGFEILSLNGSSHRRCRRCTFLNNEESTFCLACGIALVANPCLDMDQQIAINLQRKEEEAAFETLRCEEKKRKTLYQRTIFGQASILATDVQARVDTAKCRGVATFSIPDLTLHASRFINHWLHQQNEILQQQNAQQRPTVYLTYHFSSIGFNQVRVLGLRNFGFVSENMQAAYSNGLEQVLPSQQQVETAVLPRSPALYTIPEVENAEIVDGTDKLGWIVATIGGGERPRSAKSVRVSSGTAQITAFDFALTCFPLVAFDASLREDDVIRRLRNGLSQVCQYFFDDLLAPDNYNELPYEQSCEPSPSKKPKAPPELLGLCKEEEDGNIEEEEAQEDKESFENLVAEVFDSSETIFDEKVISLGATTLADVVMIGNIESQGDGTASGIAVNNSSVSAGNLSTSTGSQYKDLMEAGK